MFASPYTAYERLRFKGTQDDEISCKKNLSTPFLDLGP
jgi:hypothetical protein